MNKKVKSSAKFHDLKMVVVDLPWLDQESTCVPRTSRNAVMSGVQGPLPSCQASQLD